MRKKEPFPPLNWTRHKNLAADTIIMTKRSRFLLCISTLFLTLPAQAFLLSSAEFNNLTPTERIKYIKEVRKIFSAMNSQSDYFSLRQQLYHSFILPVQAEGSSKEPSIEDVIPNDDKAKEMALAFSFQSEKYSDTFRSINEQSQLTEAQKKKVQANATRSVNWMTAAYAIAHRVKDPQRKTALLGELLPRAETSERVAAQARALIGESANFTQDLDLQRQARAGKVDVTSPQFPNNSLKLIDSSDTIIKPTSEVRVFSAPATPPLVVTSGQKTESTRQTAPAAAAPVNTSETPNALLYRCMYSGFVVKNDPCEAPKTLPFELDGIDSDKFVCKNGVMCNPLLYVIKSDCDLKTSYDLSCLAKATPICISGGKFATSMCDRASNQTTNIEATTALISNNPQAWDEFAKNFVELCDEEKINYNIFQYVGSRKVKRDPVTIRRDIVSTCRVARTRFAVLNETYRPLQMNATTGGGPASRRSRNGTSPAPKPPATPPQSAEGTQ